jgi:lysozyme family protein
MEDKFVPSLEYVLFNEKGFDEKISDPGGAINLGISLRFYREHVSDSATSDDIKMLTVEKVTPVYHKYFWQDIFNKIELQSVCNYVFDMVVQHGYGQAIKILQRALWACNANRFSIIDDGILGEKTLEMLNFFNGDVCAPLRAERANFIKMLVYKNPNLEAEIEGLLNRCYKK